MGGNESGQPSQAPVGGLEVHLDSRDQAVLTMTAEATGGWRKMSRGREDLVTTRQVDCQMLPQGEPGATDMTCAGKIVGRGWHLPRLPAFMPVEPLLQITLENMSSLVHLSGPPLPVLQQRITYGEHWVPPLEKTADFRKVQADLLDILNKLPKPGTGRVQRPMIVKELCQQARAVGRK